MGDRKRRAHVELIHTDKHVWMYIDGVEVCESSCDDGAATAEEIAIGLCEAHDVIVEVVPPPPGWAAHRHAEYDRLLCGKTL